MTKNDIEEIIEMVSATARINHPWLMSLREPTNDEIANVQLFCEMFQPYEEPDQDNIKTVVLK